MNELITQLSSTYLLDTRAEALMLCEHLDIPEDKDSVEKALSARTRCLNTVQAIEKARKELSDPLVAAQKALIAKEKELCAKLVEYAGDIELAVGQYHAKISAENARREAIARQEAEEIRKAEAASGVEVRATPALVVHTPVADVAVIPTRQVARLVVTDLEKIPLAFFTLNESKLKTYLAAGNTLVEGGARLEFEQKLVKGRA